MKLCAKNGSAEAQLVTDISNWLDFAIKTKDNSRVWSFRHEGESQGQRG
jgi:hypothetical protein